MNVYPEPFDQAKRGAREEGVEIFLGEGNLYPYSVQPCACGGIETLEIVCKRLLLLWQPVCSQGTWRGAEFWECLKS